MEKNTISVIHHYLETQVGGAPPSVVILIILVTSEGVNAKVS